MAYFATDPQKKINMDIARHRPDSFISPYFYELPYLEHTISL